LNQLVGIEIQFNLYSAKAIVFSSEEQLSSGGYLNIIIYLSTKIIS
jgi:hypothetical protein